MIQRARRKAAARVSFVRTRSCFTAMLLVFLTATLLNRAGDVEKNPGPPMMDSESQLQRDSGGNDDSAGISRIVDSIAKLVVSQKEMKKTMEDKLDTMTDKFDTMETSLTKKLQRMEDELQITNDDIAALNLKIDDLMNENSLLKNELRKQAENIDYLENQSRRQNLVFHNIPKQSESETWNDCEEAVKEFIRDSLKITADIAIERAHRVGTVIIVKLQNYKDKELILKNAFRLKFQREGRRVGISEDFSQKVRRKRKGLMDMMKSYKKDNRKVNLVFDKLLTPDGVFSFDLESNQIQKIGEARPGYARDDYDSREKTHKKARTECEEILPGYSSENEFHPDGAREECSSFGSRERDRLVARAEVDRGSKPYRSSKKTEGVFSPHNLRSRREEQIGANRDDGWELQPEKIHRGGNPWTRVRQINPPSSRGGPQGNLGAGQRGGRGQGRSYQGTNASS